MPGFILHVGNKNNLLFPPEKRKKLILNHIDGNGYKVERRVVNKFMSDRLFVDADKYLVVVEGVVVNNHDLIANYAADNWQDCVVKMYEEEGDAFFNAFRGSFSGILYDKKNEKWLVYTNQIGDKQVFVHKTQDGYIFASEIGFIVNTLKYNNESIKLNELGANMTLSYGFCIENETLIENIYKLCAGHYFKLENGQLEEIQYHRFSNRPKHMTQQEAVEGIDKYFRQAIKRAFEKDKEYGYRHIACLSGGLDSRMTVWVAHEMGYTDQLNITYSQSGYLDFSIAQQIAIDLHHDWLFKPLDGGDCVKDIDNITEITYGSANFFGLAHGYSMERLINYNDYGMVHTGQLGDVVLGTYLKKLGYNQPVKLGDGAYSHEIIYRLKDYSLKYTYEDSELFMMYNRGFCGIGQGLLTFQENSESYSPFTDVDFFEFCYSIPLELRFNHKIYFDWILDCYPEAAKYVWEGSQRFIKRIENIKPRTMKVLGYEVPHFTDKRFKNYIKGFILRRLGLIKKGAIPKTIKLDSKNSMNPIDYWYNTNPHFKSFIEQYWNDNSHLLLNKNLGADMVHLYNDCVLYDKLQALTLLSVLKCINK